MFLFLQFSHRGTWSWSYKTTSFKGRFGGYSENQEPHCICSCMFRCKFKPCIFLLLIAMWTTLALIFAFIRWLGRIVLENLSCLISSSLFLVMKVHLFRDFSLFSVAAYQYLIVEYFFVRLWCWPHAWRQDKRFFYHEYGYLNLYKNDLQLILLSFGLHL